jgi:hypothetical protein
MSPSEVYVKAVDQASSWNDMAGAASYGRNETSPAQDIESGDSWRTQPVVVLPEGLTHKEFTLIYTNIICATGAKDLR